MNEADMRDRAAWMRNGYTVALTDVMNHLGACVKIVPTDQVVLLVSLQAALARLWSKSDERCRKSLQDVLGALGVAETTQGSTDPETPASGPQAQPENTPSLGTPNV